MVGVRDGNGAQKFGSVQLRRSFGASRAATGDGGGRGRLE